VNQPGWKDLFSGVAAGYARYRPTYPPALFAHLASLCPDRRAAWDCATGSGQAAVALAGHFEVVHATDASADQLAAATPHERVRYRLASAEHSGLEDGSVTLCTVAQALHWFAGERFFAEVKRVCRPGQSVLAAWVYNLCRISPAVDAAIETFYFDVVGPYWEPERRLIDDDYRTISVPLSPLPAPAFQMEASWSLAELLGYLGTWSAVRTATRVLGADPLAAFAPTLAAAWGAAEEKRPVRWPLTCRFFAL